MKIELKDYLFNMDKRYPEEFTPEIKANMEDLLVRVNKLLSLMPEEILTETRVTSGWRPTIVNMMLRGSAKKSKHITGQAIDLYDPDGEIDDWCFENTHILAQPDIDLYMEHPAATKNWCHLQSVPPKSQMKFAPQDRRRWFYP